MLSKPVRMERIPEGAVKDLILIFPFDLLDLILYVRIRHVRPRFGLVSFLGRSTPEMAVAIANEWFC